MDLKSMTLGELIKLHNQIGWEIGLRTTIPIIILLIAICTVVYLVEQKRQ